MIDTRSNKKGISPVISTALLVTIVVVLVSLSAFTFFQFTSNDGQPNTADATVDLSSTSSGIEATVIRNENVKQFEVRGPDNSVISILSDVGDSSRLVGPDGQYSVVAKLSNGEEEVLRTINVEDVDFSGLFVVKQDGDNEEVTARLAEPFDTDKEYDLVLNTDDNTTSGGETVGRSSGVLSSGRLLERGIPNSVNPSALNSQIQLVDIGVDRQNQNTAVEVGETINVHELTNLCVGDQLLLTGADGQTVLSGEEVTVNINCDQVRTVAQYDGTKLTGAKIINLWHQQTDYFIFEFNGETPSPILPAPDGNSDVQVTVVNSQTDAEIENADVVLGDRNSTTNSSGTALFEGIAKESNLTATASADGYFTGYKSGIVIDDSTKNVTIELNEKDGSKPVSNRESNTINSGETITYESSGGSFIIGGGSGDSLTRSTSSSDGLDTPSFNNRVFSGAEASSNIYGEDSSASTTTFGTSSPVSSPDVSDKTRESLISTTKQGREFSVIKIENRSIPNDEEFQIRTSIRNTGNEEVTDTLTVFAESTNTNNSIDLTQSDVVLPPNEDVVDIQNVSFNGTVTGEYTIFVTLDSVQQVKAAGTVELFNGNRTSSTFNPDSIEISPENPTISSGQTTKRTLQSENSDISVTVDGSGLEGANEATVELFENGQRVASKEITKDGQISYSRSFSEPQYVQYHVGILESQNVVLADSILVQEETDISLAENNIDLSISNKDDVCKQVSTNSDQFDCEIETGKELQLDSTGSTFGTRDGDYLQVGDTVNGETVESVEYVWTIGSKGQVVVNEPDTQEITFTNDTVNYIELRATANIGGKKISSTDNLIVNSYLNKSIVTSRITATDVINNFVSIDIENKRSEITEEVDLKFYKTNNTNQAVNSIKTDIRPNSKNTEYVTLTATEFDSGLEVGEKVKVLTRLQNPKTGEIIDSTNITIKRQSINTDPIIFEFTGSQEKITVPQGVSNVRIDAYGAGTRVGGGKVSGIFNVSPGDQLYIRVGGEGSGGSGGWNGGGDPNGAGASDVRLNSEEIINKSQDPRIVVAGGAGGSGRSEYVSSITGREQALILSGGTGGGFTSEIVEADEVEGCYLGRVSGATQDSGYRLGQGEDGTRVTANGEYEGRSGGGGGGYYGGFAGGVDTDGNAGCGQSGTGGSNYVSDGHIVELIDNKKGVNSGNGKIVIEWMD